MLWFTLIQPLKQHKSKLKTVSYVFTSYLSFRIAWRTITLLIPLIEWIQFNGWQFKVIEMCDRCLTCQQFGISLKVSVRWAWGWPFVAKWLHAIKSITYRSENHGIYQQITTNNCKTLEFESNTISMHGIIAKENGRKLTMYPLYNLILVEWFKRSGV